MFEKPWLELWIVTMLLVLATGVIAWTGIDISTSARFALGGSWSVGEQFPWKLLYQTDRIPAILLASAGLFAMAWGIVKPRWRHWVRPGLFLVLLLGLGPGLLVNTIFKDHWGRPRPRQVTEFGGDQHYLPPWKKGTAGQGYSFPSGHASVAFYMTAPFFILRRNRRRQAYAWLAGGMLFGIFMGVARITQGGHFLSDIVWSLGVIYLSSMLLAHLLKPDLPPAYQGYPNRMVFSRSRRA